MAAELNPEKDPKKKNALDPLTMDATAILTDLAKAGKDPLPKGTVDAVKYVALLLFSGEFRTSDQDMATLLKDKKVSNQTKSIYEMIKKLDANEKKLVAKKKSKLNGQKWGDIIMKAALKLEDKKKDQWYNNERLSELAFTALTLNLHNQNSGERIVDENIQQYSGAEFYRGSVYSHASSQSRLSMVSSNRDSRPLSGELDEKEYGSNYFENMSQRSSTNVEENRDEHHRNSKNRNNRKRDLEKWHAVRCLPALYGVFGMMGNPYITEDLPGTARVDVSIGAAEGGKFYGTYIENERPIADAKQNLLKQNPKNPAVKDYKHIHDGPKSTENPQASCLRFAVLQLQAFNIEGSPYRLDIQGGWMNKAQSMMGTGIKSIKSWSANKGNGNETLSHREIPIQSKCVADKAYSAPRVVPANCRMFQWCVRKMIEAICPVNAATLRTAKADYTNAKNLQDKEDSQNALGGKTRGGK